MEELVRESLARRYLEVDPQQGAACPESICRSSAHTGRNIVRRFDVIVRFSGLKILCPPAQL
jgi:hypothetical protein